MEPLGLERELSSAFYNFSRGWIHSPLWPLGAYGKYTNLQAGKTSTHKNKNKQIFKVQPSGANKMVYWLRTLADKLYNLSSIYRPTG